MGLAHLATFGGLQVAFISSQPKQIVSLNTIIRPASLTVWVLCIISIACVASALVLIDWFYGARNDYVYIDMMVPFTALVHSFVPLRWLCPNSFKSRVFLVVIWIVCSAMLAMAYRYC